MSENTLPPYRDTRGRWVAFCILFFFGFIFFAGGGIDRAARVRTGAPLIALALLCLSRFFWVYFEVARRRKRDWRFHKYTGPWVPRMAYSLAGGSVAFALLALWMIGLWLMAMSR